MPTTSQLILFCLTAFVLILTPGPNFIYVLTRGAAQGRPAALFAVFGLGCGVMLHTLLASIGISALIRSSYFMFQLIKYGGSLYLIYLGLQTLLHRDPLSFSPSSILGWGSGRRFQSGGKWVNCLLQCFLRGLTIFFANGILIDNSSVCYFDCGEISVGRTAKQNLADRKNSNYWVRYRFVIDCNWNLSLFLGC